MHILGDDRHHQDELEKTPYKDNGNLFNIADSSQRMNRGIKAEAGIYRMKPTQVL